VRREVLRSGAADTLAEEAARHFTMPESTLDYAAQLGNPLIPPEPPRE
jgi:hypothetical protein